MANTLTDMVDEKERNWSQMIPDLLESISDRLSLQDYLVFCCVCRNWRSAPSHRSNIISFPKQEHWCILYGFDNNDMDRCYLYCDSHPKSCQIRFPHLRGATCLISKSGWLLAKRNSLLFFFNPLSRTKIDLPKYPRDDADEQVATFSYLPTSPECTAFVIRRMNALIIEVISCCVGNTEWEVQKLMVGMSMIGKMKFARYCCDSYCLCNNKESKNCIIIWGSGLYMAYHLVYKNFTIERLQPVVTEPENCNHRPSRKDHQVEWLDKFIKNGVSISTCAVQLPSVNLAGYVSYNGIISAVDGRATTELSRVKIVWIDPVFARVLSEEIQNEAGAEEEQKEAGASTQLRQKNHLYPSLRSFASWAGSRMKKAKKKLKFRPKMITMPCRYF